MTEPLARSPRQVAIADHLWEALALISRDMGVDRDGLVNQALFAFAKQHGYLAPSGGRTIAEPAPVGFTATATAAVPYVAPPPPVAAPVTSPIAIEAAVEVPAPVEEPPAEPAPVEAEPAPAPAPGNQPFNSAGPMDPVVFEDPLPPLNAMPAMNNGQLDVPADAAPDFSMGDPGLHLSDPPPAAHVAPASAGVLVLYAEGRAVDRVTAPRFLIGRGKHCDLIINSGKVSREHAAIVREGESYFIEDLGSSNGTWYDKKRITRRQIDNGDEFFVCSEKITFRFE